MTVRMRKKGLSKFAFGWIIALAVIGIIWAIAMVAVCEALKDYEATRPGYEAEKIFNDIFKDADVDRMLAYTEDPTGEFESYDAAREYLATVISGGEMSYKEVISADSDVKMYAVSAGDVVFGAFTVGDGEKKTGFIGLRYPELKSVTIQLRPQYSVAITAPVWAEVSVNGKVLDATYIKGEPETLDPEVYFPDDDDSFRTMIRYEVTGLFSDPELAARLPGYGELTLRYDAASESYSAEYDYRTILAGRYNETVLLMERRREAAAEYRRILEEERARREEEERQAISDSIKAVYGDFIRDMARQYNKFIYAKTTAALRTATRVYFKSGTDIYKYVNGNYYNWATFVMKTIDFADEESSYYEWLDEGHTKFKCRISATVNMTGTLDGKAKEDTEYFRMTAYVDVSGAKPLVYSLVTTESDLATQ